MSLTRTFLWTSLAETGHPPWFRTRQCKIRSKFRLLNNRTSSLGLTRLRSLVDREDEAAGIGARNYLVRGLHDSGLVSVLGEQVFNCDLSRLDFCDIDV